MSKAQPPDSYDDNPEWTEEDFARAKPAGEVLTRAAMEAFKPRIGRPPGSEKERITIRLDKDILAKWRATGSGWQTRMNDALRQIAP